MKSIFEEMGGTYTLGADGMYYPDLALPEEEPHYGKYGRMRLHHNIVPLHLVTILSHGSCPIFRTVTRYGDLLS